MKLKSGALLRSLMDTRGASNADVARAAGCGRTFISALVHDRRNSCKPETAENIAQFFGVPVEVLFDPKMSAASSQHGRRKQVQRPSTRGKADAA